MVSAGTRQKRPIIIGNASGAIGDGPDQLYRLATEGPVDAIFSDYLAELNIAWRAVEMRTQPELGYEMSAMVQLQWATAAEEVAARGIKVIHDGGALNPRALYEETKKYLNSKGLGEVKVAWVEGDNVIAEVKRDLSASGAAKYPHLDIPGEDLAGSLKANGNPELLSANAYIGMRGILAALNAGAQIIVCGRVCDASPVMALSAWWHGWALTDYDRLAASLLAGHITECGPYTTGGNFCGFGAIPSLRLSSLGYPIVEISSSGTAVVTMHPGSNGAVTVDTVTAQLVYEIQGPKYLNPDVVAHIEDVHVRSIGTNRVEVTGVKGSPPPPTTKLAITTLGGYQAELNLYATGIDIRAKYELQRAQALALIDKSKYEVLSIELYGREVPDPQSEAEGTVMIRHLCMAKEKRDVEKFMGFFMSQGMAGYAGLHGSMDFRSAVPRPYAKFYPAIFPQNRIKMKVHLHDGRTLDVKPVPDEETAPFTGQVSYGPKVETDLRKFGETTRAPLGRVVLARSGDKGANANVGFWVRRDDEWPWLQSFLTIPRLITLLGKDYDPSYRVERFEMPHIRAVHFVVYGVLGQGVSESSRLDGLAKSFGEFLRAREVDVPRKFLERTKVGEEVEAREQSRL